MASSFPTSLDTFTNPTSADALDSVSVPHATQHSDLNDAVEALEAKVGADGSAVVSSHDYKIAQLEAEQSLVRITSATFTTSSAVAFASGVFTSTYDNFRVVFEFVPSANCTLACQVNVSGSAQTANSYFGNRYDLRAGSVVAANPGTSHSIMGANGSTPAHNSFSIDVIKPADATVRTSWHGTWYGANAAGSFDGGVTAAEYNVVEAHDGLTLTPSTGTITGKYTVYGYV